MSLFLAIARCCFLAALLLSSSVVIAQPTITIGVVMDGPMTEPANLRETFFGEITALTEGEFNVRFPADKHIDGAWSLQKIQSGLQQLQDDPGVDMVLALGFVSSYKAATSENLRKPTFAPLVVDAELLELPVDGDVSGVKNLNYLTDEIRFAEDLDLFLQITSISKMALLVDETLFQSVPELTLRASNIATEKGIELIYVLNSHEDEDIVSKIPQGIDAVMLAGLPRLSPRAREQMVTSLLERDLPSFSLIGNEPVGYGVLMSQASSSDWKRLARRTALNMQAVILGDQAGRQPVVFRRKHELTINMETANKLDLSPPFEILNRANLLNDHPFVDGPTYTLQDVAKAALQANLDIAASQLELRASEQGIFEARSILRPQVDIAGGITQVDDSTDNVKQGLVAERTTQLAINLSQILYSEVSRANVEIQKFRQRAQEELHRQLQLDIVQSAVVAFLNVLKAQTQVKIRRDDLKLSRTNLELAKDRLRIGASNAADVFRWESQEANALRSLINADAALQQSMDVLNLLLHRPIAERFGTIPATLEDPTLMINNKELIDIIDNDKQLKTLVDLFIQLAVQRSPELLNFDAQIAASQRDVLSRQRAYWSPDVSLAGQVANVLDESRVTGNEQDGEFDWQLGVNLSLPLYQGGGRRARLSRAQYEQHQLQVQRRAIAEQVEQSVRRNIHEISASFPSIELAHRAAQAAKRNLELVANNYAQGTLSIIDLLDAQNASLAADQAAADAVFELLTDYMNLQRATGQFDFFLDDVERNQSIENIKQYLNQAQ